MRCCASFSALYTPLVTNTSKNQPKPLKPIFSPRSPCALYKTNAASISVMPIP